MEILSGLPLISLGSIQFEAKGKPAAEASQPDQAAATLLLLDFFNLPPFQALHVPFGEQRGSPAGAMTTARIEVLLMRLSRRSQGQK